MPAVVVCYLLVVAAAVAWQIYCERKHAVFPIGFGWLAVSAYCAVVVASFEGHRGTPALLLGAVIGYLFGKFSMVVFVAISSVPVQAYYRWREMRLMTGADQTDNAEAQ